VSGYYDETIAFYRDLVGLPVVDQFNASFGEDGTIFGLPGTELQLEIVRAHGGAIPSMFDQLVLYLDNSTTVTQATALLRSAGHEAIADPHPYWAANGAVTYKDPDGRDVVFAPWVFGREPDPIDRPAGTDGGGAVRIGWYGGDREVLRVLFAEAEDSARQLDSYINDGRLLVAWRGVVPVGHLQLVDAGTGTLEIKNMAVVASARREGIGRTLVERAIAAARRERSTRVVVATASADVDNLRFYQRCGFRMARVERDAFTPEHGYPAGLAVDGIPLCDRVWLDCFL
jgi:GNAT superfamily N-acetyltransferase